MEIDRITADDVRGRQASADLIATDRKQALRVARQIRHPWYRCQALAALAEAASDTHQCQALLNESLAAAYEQHEPNRVVSVATWPLACLVRTAPEQAQAVVERLLGSIATEPHGLRKLDGLARVLFTVNGLPSLREQVLPAFLTAVAASVGWRTERIVESAVEMLAAVDPATATALLATRTSNRYSRRAAAKLGKAAPSVAA